MKRKITLAICILGVKRTSPVVHHPPKPAKVPHYSSDNIGGQNIDSGNSVNEMQPHFLPTQFVPQSQPTPNNMQNFQPTPSSLEPPLMSPEITSGPSSTGRCSKNDEGRFFSNSKTVL